MTDYLDQLVEAGGREIAGGAIALVVGLTRIECDFLARAALTAALAHPLTDPCPTCSGDGFAARPGSYDRATGSEKPCAACDGTGRVPASVRLMLGERYDCARDQVATLREALEEFVAMRDHEEAQPELCRTTDHMVWERRFYEMQTAADVSARAALAATPGDSDGDATNL